MDSITRALPLRMEVRCTLAGFSKTESPSLEAGRKRVGGTGIASKKKL